ncbi:uncharacterized protein [Cicer arietinum]|uniref:uncharacterized protein isoform X3 n=1 Tax=Cicer arietinum TaxID=3827 RepID=UPI003CC61388
MVASTVLSNFPLHFTCCPSSAHKNPQPNLSLRFNPPLNRAFRSRFCVAAILPQRLPRRVFRVHGLVGDDDSLTSPLPDLHNSEACAGCKRHHKLVDHLGLITEYDFREKMNTHSEIVQNQQ